MRHGISAIEYELPAQSFSLAELAEAGLLASRPEQLREFGFERCYISSAPAEELAFGAVARLLKNTGTEAESVDLLLYAGAIAASHEIAGEHFLSRFNYPAAKLQYEHDRNQNKNSGG